MQTYFSIDVVEGRYYVLFDSNIVALLRSTFNIDNSIDSNSREFEKAVNSALKNDEISAVGKIPSSGEYYIKLGMLLRITNDERCPYKVIGVSTTKNTYGDLCNKYHFILKSSPIKDKNDNCG